MSSPFATYGQASKGKKLQIARLWQDDERFEQRRRLDASWLQDGDPAAVRVVREIEARLPPGAAAYVPSRHVFARVLGLLRTAASYRVRLVLSVADMATRLGFARSTVAAALRWLGTEPIVVDGRHVADGLGVVRRERRWGRAYVGRALVWLYRTSATTLTVVGRALLFCKPERTSATYVPRAEYERRRDEAAVAADEASWAEGLAGIDDPAARAAWIRTKLS